jgi:predicted glycoside hydrolase/deacetylase ChbG (UPF0249 family)
VTPAAVALCADDYAQHQGIDDAVCALLAQQRLTAVSCMSGAPRWLGEAAPRLREFAACADVGLHLNLTESFGARGASLAALIVGACSRSIDKQALRASFERQFDAFEAGMGSAPDFIDGHQHVHQLPRVREVLFELIARRYGARKPWVRNTLAGAGVGGAKQALLMLLGGRVLARRLAAAGIPTNAGFAGVYGFDTDDYAGRFDRWLAGARDGTLLMCHPAASGCAGDPIGRQRQVEYRFLRSDAFTSMLAARRVRLVRLSSLLLSI